MLKRPFGSLKRPIGMLKRPFGSNKGLTQFFIIIFPIQYFLELLKNRYICMV